MNVDGKVIWITGASTGIGEALVIELSKINCKSSMIKKVDVT